MTNQSSSGIRRPPCKKCGLQVCTSHQELFDSVVANLMYREFVVYDRCQTYPEYIIWYKWTIEKLNYSKISRKNVCHFFFIVSIICIQNKPKRWRHAYLFQNWKKMFINFQDFKKVFIWFFFTNEWIFTIFYREKRTERVISYMHHQTWTAYILL